MKKNNLAAFSAVFALLLCLGILGSFYLSTQYYSSENKIILPTSDMDTSLNSNDDLYKNNVDDLEIDKNNVKDVIASLNRPSEYTALVESTIYWSTSSRSTKYNLYVSGSKKRIECLTSDGAVDYYNLIIDDIVYSFNSSGDYAQYYIGDFSEDDYIQIPSYEDIADLNRITDAKLMEYNNEMCIFVEADSFYREEYIISAVNGLLYSYIAYDDTDTVVRKSQISNIKTDEISDDYFEVGDSDGN